MLVTNPIPNTIDYCCNDMPYAQCGERCVLTREQAEAGLNPLATVPAQSWGYLWHATNEAVHCIRYAACVLIDEINTVLCCAGVTPNPSCSNQLYQALDNIYRVVGTAEKAGSVKSSSIPGEVSINSNGIMTANCVGNASQLATVCTEITGAVNELKTNYDTAFSNIWTSAGCKDAEKADNNHASATTAYGVGNASCYGHLMITDTCDTDCGNAGMVASQKAVYDIWYKVTNQAALGNTLPANLGNAASAGTCSTASRSDHVHCRQACAQCIERIGYTWATCCYPGSPMYYNYDCFIDRRISCCVWNCCGRCIACAPQWLKYILQHTACTRWSADAQPADNTLYDALRCHPLCNNMFCFRGTNIGLAKYNYIGPILCTCVYMYERGANRSDCYRGCWYGVDYKQATCDPICGYVYACGCWDPSNRCCYDLCICFGMPNMSSGLTTWAGNGYAVLCPGFPTT